MSVLNIIFINDFSYQEVKDAEAEELEGEAHVAKVVEPVEHAAAEAGRGKEVKCELYADNTHLVSDCEIRQGWFIRIILLLNAKVY